MSTSVDGHATARAFLLPLSWKSCEVVRLTEVLDFVQRL